MSKPYRGHKRQKLSVLNVGYYFSESSTPQQHHQTPVPHTIAHPSHSASPPIEENIYDNDDYSLSYSFPHGTPHPQHILAPLTVQRPDTNPSAHSTPQPQQQGPVANPPPYYQPSYNLDPPYPLDPYNYRVPQAKHKNNLSISSHFNLFNLQETSSDKRFGLPLPPPQTNVVNDLLVSLISVDGSNINNYLLSVLYKLNVPLPLDDFYNLLYNTDKAFVNVPKIDRTFVSTLVPNTSIDAVNQLLNVFKNPNVLGSIFPNVVNKENKLTNINYHELLRTFLAIKILFDVLIQLPPNAEEPQNYTIPRLSIYKTYFIICQKLISQYPSSSNTTNEQQKLILGQLKLGKLIKLVYPNLLIKRLGSRGESKYNYLGVIWNENIVLDEVKELCDKYELVELNEVFAKSMPVQRDHRRSKSGPSVPRRRQYSHSSTNAAVAAAAAAAVTDPGTGVVSPELSFIQLTIKFPPSAAFTILGEQNWFLNVKYLVYAKLEPLAINYVTIHDIFLNNDNLLQKEYLVKNFINRVLFPVLDGGVALQLHVYLVVVVELLPYLLLIKSSTEINFLKNLRLNLLHLINTLSSEAVYKHDAFNQKHASIFLLVLKKLINLNDLLITFIKLIIKDNSDTRTGMALVIESFFTDPLDSRNLSVSEGSTVSSESEYEVGGFKNVLSNDLLYTLIGYNFDPTVQDHKSSISMNFINQEINLIDDFFRHDLLDFLKKDDVVDPELDDPKELILSSRELSKLQSLIELIDHKLLSENFKEKYPVLVFNNYITFILNDLLKYIFLKQQHQLKGEPKNSFGNWWVFNSFIQEYVSLLGEVVGLSELA